MSKTGSFKVRILGCNYKLKPGDSSELRGKWGFCDFQKRLILYADYLAESAIRECVFHELLHVADSSVSTEKTELTEEQITRLSSVLFGVLRDHSHLVDWLFKDEDGEKRDE